MGRLTAVQALTRIGDHIAVDHFKSALGGIFLRPCDERMSSWISLAGTDYSLSPVFGVLSKDVNRIVNRALRAVIPTFKATRPGVPLFRITPERLSPDDQRIISRRTDEPGYLKDEIDNFVKYLRDTCYPFLEANCTLRSALDLALKLNKYDQAQLYYVPALMLLVGSNDDKKIYVCEAVKRFPSEAAGAVEMYLKFIDELDKRL
jgi:hypothetical protein